MNTQAILNHPFVYNLVQTLFSMDFLQTIAPLIRSYPHARVVEIGCGTGELVKFLGSNKYIGIDINSQYIQYATNRFANKERTFLLADATKMKPLSGVFDLVLMINMTHHLSDDDFRVILKRLPKVIRFKRLIIIDGKPDIGPLNKLLEWADPGNYFRELSAIKKIVNDFFTIERGSVIRKPYWIYKSPLVVAKRKKA